MSIIIIIIIIIMYYSEYVFFLADLRNFCCTGDGSGMNTFLHMWSPFGHFGRRFVAGILRPFFFFFSKVT
jgi:hypothetical protein